ncbi:MAG: ectoine hydrolase DoeA [Gammaproteobacteria bacterium]
MPFNFPRQEYDSRIAKTRAEMARRGIALLLVSDPSNMAWLCGYDGWSFYVHQCVLLPAAGAPLWYGRGIDAAGARRTVFMPPENIIGYPDDYVQNPARHPMEHLSEVIADLGFAGAAIGVEMDNYYFSAAAWRTLVARLPGANWMDATALVNWQRAVKSRAEIDCMRRAARIVERMHRCAFECIAPGMKKNDWVAEITRCGIQGIDGHAGDYPAIVPLAPSGRDAGAPHLTWDERPLPKRAGTFLEIAGVYRRYHCPMSRTFYLGKPPKKFRRAEAALQDGIAAALATAAPGNRCCDVAAALTAALARHGLDKDNRCGYAVGLSYPPDWGERTMSFRAADESVLAPGMTFHFMPGLWFDDWGVEMSESLLITEDGCEALANVPRELFVKEI